MKKNGRFDKLTIKGFTLIELLVVIAIIGILSSVILASLNTARDKAKDSKVKSQLAGVRNSAEVFFSSAGGYNGTAGNILNDCATVDSMFQDAGSGMSQYTDLAYYPPGTTLRCSSTATEYAMSGSLNTAGQFWCVDSLGTSRLVLAVDHATAHPDDDTTCN